MDNIAYLIEAPDISNTGKLRNKSIRAFEVKYTIGTSNPFWSRIEVISTGKLFTLIDGKVTEKRTKATLKTKYIRGLTPSDTITSVDAYHCQLFTTPTLALLAKSIALKSRVQSKLTEIEDALSNAKASLAYAAQTDTFTSNYPEYLV